MLLSASSTARCAAWPRATNSWSGEASVPRPWSGLGVTDSAASPRKKKRDSGPVPKLRFRCGRLHQRMQSFQGSFSSCCWMNLIASSGSLTPGAAQFVVLNLDSIAREHHAHRHVALRRVESDLGEVLAVSIVPLDRGEHDFERDQLRFLQACAILNADPDFCADELHRLVNACSSCSSRSDCLLLTTSILRAIRRCRAAID